MSQKEKMADEEKENSVLDDSSVENGNTKPTDTNTEDKKESDNIKKEKELLKKESKEHVVSKYLKLLQKNEKLAKTLEKKEEEANDFLNKYKRTLADMENLRKRTITEKQDSLKYANFNIIGDLLVILDDFQRAIESAKGENNENIKDFVNGIEMIEKQFIDLLFKKYGVVKYGEKDEEFDPKIHIAMMMEEGDFKEEVVLEVFRNGYSLHDRVIRPAQVKVGKPKE